MARPRRESLSAVDAAWLRMDQPTNLMQVVGVMFFDEPLPAERVRTLVAERLLHFDRFRQRVIDPGMLGLGPYWEDALDFDIERHVVIEDLAEHTEEALQDRVGELMSTPLDPGHPLWRLHVVEGVGRGSAVIGRFHHCIADGIALIYVMLSMMDEGPLAAQAPRTGKESSRSKGEPFTLDAMVGALRRAMGTTIGAAGTVLDEGVSLFSQPHRTVDLAGLALSGAGSLVRLVSIPPDSPTSLKGPLGITKRCAWSPPYPLARVKEIGRVLGGTINDVLITAAAGAVRRYLETRHEPTENVDVRAMVPVNLRPIEDAARLGNHFGLVYLTLPVGIDDPFDRFLETKARMDEIKRSPDALVAFQILKALGFVPRGGTKPLVGLFASKATAVMTNVPGPREPIFLAGVQLSRAMFWVPRAGGLGLGLSILSYSGQVYVGIAADTGLVPDPRVLVDGYHAALTELMDIVEAPQRH